MGLLGAWIAILVPWALATVIVRRTCFESGPGSVGASVGYGFFLGLLPAAGLFGLQGHIGLPLNPWPIIAAMLAVLVALSWWLRARLTIVAREITASELTRALWPEGRWSRLLAIGILAWVAIRFATLAFAVSTYSLFPWDAWTTWALRAKVWTELGQWVPFVAPDVWLADVEGVSRTTAAWHYPELPSWVSAWAATAAGGWREQAANAPALGALVALLADRPFDGNTVPVELPHGRIPFSTSPVLLSLLSGAPIVPVGITRESDGRFRVEAAPPVWPEWLPEGRAATFEKFTRELAEQGLVPMFRNAPDQWHHYHRLSP
jgi:hypothetical protein